MEFESMDNCFPTAQDDSATTFNGRSTRGLWHLQSRTGNRVGRLVVQQLQLRQPVLRPHSKFRDSAPSPPAVDIRYGSSSAVD